MNVKLTLDERYFNWLCTQVGALGDRDPANSYILLAEQLFKKSFDDSTPNDYNRALDGKDFRTEFLEETGAIADQEWLDLDSSIFEMMIGLARRLSFSTDWEIDVCFWLLITNLELEKYSDERFNDGVVKAVDFVLDTVNDRSYESNGRGGLFPLKDPRNDQREIEIWYQMSAYILENIEF